MGKTEGLKGYKLLFSKKVEEVWSVHSFETLKISLFLFEHLIFGRKYSNSIFEHSSNTGYMRQEIVFYIFYVIML